VRAALAEHCGARIGRAVAAEVARDERRRPRDVGLVQVHRVVERGVVPREDRLELETAAVERGAELCYRGLRRLRRRRQGESDQARVDHVGAERLAQIRKKTRRLCARRARVSRRGEAARALQRMRSMSDAEGARALHRGRGPLSFALLSVALGVVSGVGAFVFRMLIGLVHNALLLGRLSFSYDSNVHTPPSPWGWAVVLVPVVGSVAVVFLVRNFAPEARGHGVPEVMDAIYYQKGAIRPVVAAVKSVASAISIGSGGSVGREGPIIQIGAAFASWAGRLARVSRWQLLTLVAAGGGAGIAATFNTPLGGVLFAVEILMHEVSVRTLVPVALATTTATYVGERLLGNTPAFAVPALALPSASHPALLPVYLGLGVLMGLTSTLFIRALYATEDLFDAWIRKNDYLRHAVGMLGVGIVAQSLMAMRGHYYVEGVGYATILDVLSGSLGSVTFLALLFGLKLATTSLTLGSGASGGIFSPSLFMGAVLGGAYGLALRALLPGSQVDATALAVAGMGGLVAGATGAALTAIVMIFEMTRDYAVVLPMTLTVAVSYGLRRLLVRESIYTMKLARRGHYMPEALQTNAHLVHHVTDITIEPAEVVAADSTADALDLDDEAKRYFVLEGGGRVLGVLERDWALAHARELAEARSLAAAGRHDFVTVDCTATVFEMMRRLRKAHAKLIVVLEDGGGVRGVLSGDHLAQAIAEALEPFDD
jgi:CIC family chloride channel protein